MAENNPEIRNLQRERASLPLFEASGLSSTDMKAAQCETGADGGSMPPSRKLAGLSAPDKAFARKSDGRNSHAAAASVVNLGPVRDRIMDVLSCYGPMTDERIWETFSLWINAPKVSPSGLRSRRAELVKMKLVREVGTGKTKAGRNCSVWGLSERSK